MSTYLVDLETTGTDPESDAPVSICVLRIVKGGPPVTILETRFNPVSPIPAGA